MTGSRPYPGRLISSLVSRLIRIPNEAGGSHGGILIASVRYTDQIHETLSSHTLGDITSV